MHDNGTYEIKVSGTETINIPVKSINIGGIPIEVFVEDIQDIEGLESNENYKVFFEISKEKNKEDSNQPKNNPQRKPIRSNPRNIGPESIKSKDGR